MSKTAVEHPGAAVVRAGVQESLNFPGPCLISTHEIEYACGHVKLLECTQHEASEARSRVCWECYQSGMVDVKSESAWRPRGRYRASERGFVQFYGQRSRERIA